MRSASKNTQSKGPGRVRTISVAEPSCTVIISLRPAVAMFDRACCTLLGVVLDRRQTLSPRDPSKGGRLTRARCNRLRSRSPEHVCGRC